jgi:HEPN domain-containing protein
MLLFSQYAGALPWPVEETRSSLDPFTGCFVLGLPFTTALLCLALKALSLSDGNAEAHGIHPDELLRLGARRLRPLLERHEEDPGWMERSYDIERRAWHAYYDILDWVEEEAREKSADATQLIRKAEEIIEATRVVT